MRKCVRSTLHISIVNILKTYITLKTKATNNTKRTDGTCWTRNRWNQGTKGPGAPEEPEEQENPKANQGNQGIRGTKGTRGPRNHGNQYAHCDMLNAIFCVISISIVMHATCFLIHAPANVSSATSQSSALNDAPGSSWIDSGTFMFHENCKFVIKCENLSRIFETLVDMEKDL